MYEETSNVQLISSKKHKNGKARKDRSGNQVFHLSDSEGGNFDSSEETTVHSDGLYGDSLPSMRAQLAATQMQNRSRRKEEVQRSRDETKILLASDNGGGGATASMKKENLEEGNHGQYNSLGGNIISTKRKAKVVVLKQ